MAERAHRIMGTWPDGSTLTAVQRNRSLDGEWMDERFGQALDVDLDIIGPETPADRVLERLKNTFWDGATRVVYVEEP